MIYCHIGNNKLCTYYLRLRIDYYSYLTKSNRYSKIIYTTVIENNYFHSSIIILQLKILIVYNI